VLMGSSGVNKTFRQTIAMHSPLVRLLLPILTLIVTACAGSSASAPTETAKKITPPSGATEAMVARGELLFSSGSCRACHGLGGQNGPYGPNLTDDVWLQIDGSYSALIGLITTGVPAEKFKSPTSRAEFAMYPRGGQSLSDDDVKAVAAYVWTLSHPNG
jgi:mono/diheme cytochrome c family protein